MVYFECFSESFPCIYIKQNYFLTIAPCVQYTISFDILQLGRTYVLLQKIVYHPTPSMLIMHSEIQSLYLVPLHN
jgi:hypothetical protein